MKTDKNILIAFLLNLGFAIFEVIGGFVTGSVAIASDALHDLGDAISIGISYFMERKSKRPPDNKYTYGYTRFSVMGSIITTTTLIIGSIIVLASAVQRLIFPADIHYPWMIAFAAIGVAVNFIAAYVTRAGDSLNQKAVNLHMLEDVMGWVIVLIGAIVMYFTDWYFIDALLSIATALFIAVRAAIHFIRSSDVLNEKVPAGISIKDVTKHIEKIKGVESVHHLHIWTLDGHNHCATMHVVTNAPAYSIKQSVREELLEHGIRHSTIEIEAVGEECNCMECNVEITPQHDHHHHHH
jgi:cobalt-zinc-cadmium efflux system protein